MESTRLESRQDKILEFIIRAHVDSGAPVGSKAVCERFHLRISPATVRNVMGRLEGMGLITHPHTSAGRVPTDKGYRYFVNALMQPENLTDQEREPIDRLRQVEAESPSALLHEACRQMAGLTQQVGVVLPPNLLESTLSRIDLIRLNEHRVMSLLLTSEGLMHHAMLELEDELDAAEISRVARFFNDEFEGLHLDAIEAEIERSLIGANSALHHLYQRAQALWSLGAFVDTENRLFLDGVSQLLSQREFQNAERTKSLLEVLESQDPLFEEMSEAVSSAQQQTVIGSEHQHPALRSCGLVIAPYRVGGRVIGALGVVGPTRMDYGKMNSIVGSMAEAAGEAMERLTP